MNEITYTPGRLAKKIGVSRNTVIKHCLVRFDTHSESFCQNGQKDWSNTGLLHHCARSPNGTFLPAARNKPLFFVHPQVRLGLPKRLKPSGPVNFTLSGSLGYSTTPCDTGLTERLHEAF